MGEGRSRTLPLVLFAIGIAILIWLNLHLAPAYFGWHAKAARPTSKAPPARSTDHDKNKNNARAKAPIKRQLDQGAARDVASVDAAKPVKSSSEKSSAGKASAGDAKTATTKPAQKTVEPTKDAANAKKTNVNAANAKQDQPLVASLAFRRGTHWIERRMMPSLRRLCREARKTRGKLVVIGYSKTSRSRRARRRSRLMSRRRAVTVANALKKCGMRGRIARVRGRLVQTTSDPKATRRVDVLLAKRQGSQ
jgi:flagellar motor protein MotB